MVLVGCAGAARRVSYARDVQPVFNAKCSACHPVSFPQLDLSPGRSYAELVRVPAVGNRAFLRVVPGKPELSWLLIHPKDRQVRGLLSAEEIQLITRWIRDGAPDN